MRISQDSGLVWELRELASVPRDEWLVGSVATLPGQALTFQLVAGGDSTEPDYLALDDISLSNVEDCRTEPPEALLPDTTSSTAGQCAHHSAWRRPAVRIAVGAPALLWPLSTRHHYQRQWRAARLC